MTPHADAVEKAMAAALADAGIDIMKNGLPRELEAAFHECAGSVCEGYFDPTKANWLVIAMRRAVMEKLARGES